MAELRTRPTIMDGEVIIFAESFNDREKGPLGPRSDPEGPYEVSASRNMVVVVHRAEIEQGFQAVMARLADLLDSDQFNNIEAIALEAGLTYPPMRSAETGGEP